MDLTTATFCNSQESVDVSRPVLHLPPFYPFSQPDLFYSCRFWGSSVPAESQNEQYADEIFLKQVMTPPSTTTVRIVVPLPFSCSSSSSLLPSRPSSTSATSEPNGPPDRRPRSSSSSEQGTVEPRQETDDSIKTSLRKYANQFSKNLLQHDQQQQQQTVSCSYHPASFPEVLFVSPHRNHTSINNPLVEQQQQFQQQLLQQQLHQQQQRPSPPLLFIVVDSGCGEAVLRGGDVYAPGILASNRSFEKGEVADFVCAMVGGNPVGNVSIAGAGAPLVGSYVAEPDLSYIRKNTVVVAKNCQVEMSRLECFNGKPRSGLAIRTNGGIFHHPSMTVLCQVGKSSSSLASSAANNNKNNKNNANGNTTTPPFQPFLQNVSSLFPASCLMKKLFDQYQNHQSKQPPPPSSSPSSPSSPPLRLLDMCAAPGGKSSHILSRFALSFPSDFATAQNIRLVCCEKSAPRAKQLKQVLEDHHGVDTINKCVLVVGGDSNRILKAGSKENDAVARFFAQSDKAAIDNHIGSVTNNNSDDNVVDSNNSSNNSNNLLFDAVLLDPPCTGFGLRPRLRTFEVVDDKGVEAVADYQRKLLSTAVALVRPGGFISYSTCTTSRQENEMNVSWAVANLPVKVLRLKTDLMPMTTAVDDESDVAADGEGENDCMFKRAIESGMCRSTMKFVSRRKCDDNDNNNDNNDNDDDDVDDDDHDQDTEQTKSSSLLVEDFPNISNKKFADVNDDTACVLRFGPSNSGIDSVGFFLTMFQKIK